MDYSKLSRLNIKHLTVLHVLLMTHSVSATAMQLCVTPSSVSKALGQLKLQLGDELFFRSGSGLIPTQYAVSIGPAVHHILCAVNGLLQQGEFDPQLFHGSLTLSMRESTFELFAEKISHITSKLGRNGRLNIVAKEPQIFEALQSGKVDFMLLPHDISQPPTQSKNLTWQHVLDDEMVCLMRDSHPLAAQPLTVAGYLSQRHIGVMDKDLAQPYFEQTLAQRHGEREVAIAVADFGSAALMCHHSDYLFTCSKRWAQTAKQAQGLIIKPLPFDYGQVTYSLVWNPTSLNNPACYWLHEQILAVAI